MAPVLDRLGRAMFGIILFIRYGNIICNGWLRFAKQI